MIKEVRSHPEEFPCWTILHGGTSGAIRKNITNFCIFTAYPRRASFNVDIIFDTPPTKQWRGGPNLKSWRTSRDAKIVRFSVNFLSVHAWTVSSHCILRTIWHNSFVTNNVNLCFEVNHFLVAVGVAIAPVPYSCPRRRTKTKYFVTPWG